MNYTSSFDIFDTCLIRSCGPSSALFDILASEAFSCPVSYAIRHEFIIARINAESHNNLQSIYTNIEFSHEHLLPVNKLIENELSIEDSLLKPSKKILALVNQCRTKGHRIIFISDMYLPSSFLRKQLAKWGFWKDGDKLYVSNEIKKTKSSGELFSYIAQKESLRFKKWHHYGDNLQSDVIIPHKYGIKSTQIKSGYSLYQKKWMDTTICTQFQLGPILAGLSRSITLSEVETSQTAITLDIIAPLLVSFVCRIFNHARLHGITHLYFCARDSRTAFEIANQINHLFQDITVHYLYISRQALYDSDEKDVLSYFKHVGLATQSESVAIIDMRTTGKSLKYINSLLQKYEFNPVYGYFFEMFCTGTAMPNMPPYYCEINSVYNNHANIPTRALSSLGILLEMFFSIHKEPKTIGYNIFQDENTYPIFSNLPDEEDCSTKNTNEVVRIRESLILRYTEAFIKLHLHEHADDCMNQIALPTLSRFLVYPEKNYLAALTDFHVRNEYTSKLQPFIEKLSLLDILRRKKGLSWRRGSMAWTLPTWLYRLHYKLPQ